MCVVIAIGSCHRSKQKPVILQREWTANAEFAGDVVAVEVAAKHGMQLQVKEGSETLDPIKTVRAGLADFGVASADRVLRENEGGADLVIIAAATFRSPVVFLTREDLRIGSPGDFRGRTIGIQAGTNTDLVFRALIHSQKGLALDDMTIVDPGWGTGAFEARTVDVLGAFAYDEPITLQLKHITFGEIVPEHYGVRYVGTVYFTRWSVVRKETELTQTFMDALVEGWKVALADPNGAIERLAQRFDDVRTNKQKELMSLEKGREFFGGGDCGLLCASNGRFEAMPPA